MELLNILNSIIQRKTDGYLTYGSMYYWEIYEYNGQLEQRSTLYARDAIINMMFDLSLQGKHLELIRYDCDFFKREICFKMQIVEGVDLQTPDIADAVSKLP